MYPYHHLLEAIKSTNKIFAKAAKVYTENNEDDARDILEEMKNNNNCDPDDYTYPEDPDELDEDELERRAERLREAIDDERDLEETCGSMDRF